MMQRQSVSSQQFTAIDLFSGCGGLTQGLKDAGFKVLAAVENDDLAAEAYAMNHKDVLLVNQDIRSVVPEHIFSACNLKPFDLDLLAACPPCQGFSRLKNNNKLCRLADPRNRLIDEITRIVHSLLPKVIMLENVPRLAMYTRFTDFKRELRRIGYEVSEQIHNVADFGVPQRRKRLVVLASRIGQIQHITPFGTKRTVKDAIGNLPPVETSSDLLHTASEFRSDRIKQLIKAIPKDGGSRSALNKSLSLKCHENCNGFYDVYGRMSWNDVAPTITGGCINPSKGRFLHPVEDRAITLREAALLQTFPSQYLFPLRRGKYAVAQMIGNALPPVFCCAHATAIKQFLSHQRSKQTE